MGSTKKVAQKVLKTRQILGSEGFYATEVSFEAETPVVDEPVTGSDSYNELGGE